MSINAKKLVYEKHGDPEKVIRLEEFTISTNSLGPNEVLVRWLATPINPADILQVNGLYGIQPPLPAIGGFEGCGEVEKVGSKVTSIQPGDWVIPGADINTWCTHNVYDADKLAPVPKMPKLFAATLLVNPPTAYHLLKSMTELKPGDIVAQNGANSACGRYIIQLAHLWGYKTINIVRNRPGIQELKNELKDLGADEVYTEDEFDKLAPTLKNVKLAIDCVGGEKTLALIDAIAEEGTIAVYGALAGQPAQIENRLMVFKEIRIKGFWIMKWYLKNSKETINKVFGELGTLVSEGKLKESPYAEYKIEDFAEAFRAARSSTNRKQIFVF